ncbi:MAG: HD domain-containing protein [Rhodospirillales bacterium]|nr:HD domain-containing protein [Rhodospirillales bacterium]
MFSEDDWAFINHLNGRFPHLREAFERAVALPPRERLEWAEAEIGNVLRSGYLVRGIPEDQVETVREHTDDGRYLIQSWVQGKQLRREADTGFRFHDIIEAITWDFHWEDDITADEKGRVEMLSADVIFEHDPHNHRRYWDDYRLCRTEAARIEKDADKNQVLFRTLGYRSNFPHLKNRLDEFWNNLKDRQWFTQTGYDMHGYAKHLRQVQEAIYGNPKPRR